MLCKYSLLQSNIVHIVIATGIFPLHQLSKRLLWRCGWLRSWSWCLCLLWIWHLRSDIQRIIGLLAASLGLVRLLVQHIQLALRECLVSADYAYNLLHVLFIRVECFPN